MHIEEQELCDEAPTLILGLIGFNREQQEAVALLLRGPVQGQVRWRTGSIREADAWCVNGARTQLLGDGSLRVGPAEVGCRSIRLALEEVDRPVAFSEPLASREFEPAYSFRMGDPRSLEAMLEAFRTRWLENKAACLWLASRLVAAEHTLKQRVYHLMHRGQLVAMIDRAGDVALMPGLGITDLQESTWVGRPSSAAYTPPAFYRTTISELVWSYGLRTEADLLPARYREGPIYFRRPPRVAQRLIEDDHLLVIRALVVGAVRFDELRERTGLDPRRLARTLAALYLAGSITTNPQRVRQAPAAGPVESSSNDESVWSSTRSRFGFGPSASALQADFTVPARLPTGACGAVVVGP